MGTKVPRDVFHVLPYMGICVKSLNLIQLPSMDSQSQYEKVCISMAIRKGLITLAVSGTGTGTMTEPEQ